MNVARVLKLDDEGSVGGERVGVDGVGEETLWEPVLREEIVDVRR